MMRDPYLYDDVGVPKNLAEIKDADLLHKAEADITNLAMTGLYNIEFDSFDTAALQEVHRIIFGQIYDWAGAFRTIQMEKPEDMLGGDTVRYVCPKEIKRRLTASMKELAKLKRSGENDRDVVFRLVRVMAQIWQTHPFREGNMRSVIVFTVLFANAMGFSVEHEVFQTNAAYVRNALVWAAQGISSKYEYLEQIFFDAILHEDISQAQSISGSQSKYEQIGDYKVKDYKERPHNYADSVK